MNQSAANGGTKKNPFDHINGHAMANYAIVALNSLTFSMEWSEMVWSTLVSENKETKQFMTH